MNIHKPTQTNPISTPSLKYWLACIILTVAGCGPQIESTKPDLTRPGDTEETRQTAADVSEATSSQLSDFQTAKLRRYIELSDTNEGPLRQQYILEMAAWLYEELELKAAIRAIEKLKPEYLSAEQIFRAQLLKARILLSEGKDLEVLQTLPGSINNLPRSQQIDVLDLRAQAFLGANYPFEAVRTRLQLNQILSDGIELEDNLFTTWRVLNLMPLSSLTQVNELPLDPVMKGWIELAITSKQHQNNWQHLEQAYQDWARSHPSHPAGGTFLKTLAQQQTELIKHPTHIAMLLPLTGKYAAVARVIRDGFLSAYYNSNQTQNQPKISVIDVTDNEQNIMQYYQQAVQKGADFIVGPLSKTAIDNLSKVSDLPVPVLTLNYGEQQTSVTGNLFQFGLLPEDEAKQVAEIAIKQNKKHAAILTPNSDWGERLQSAFQQRFEELGGEVRSIKKYQPKRNDFSDSITNLLNLSQSNQRYSAIKQVLHSSPKFEPYRRQDIDMIFIAGSPRAARSILPQLKFHQASDLQVYATSHAFSGTIDKRADRDINQLVYCDIPWALDQNANKRAVEKYWPDSNKHYTRLFALGADAFHLIPYLERLKARSHERFNGYTGNLYLDPLMRIHRELVWAQFQNGVPVPLNANEITVTYTPPLVEEDTPEPDIDKSES